MSVANLLGTIVSIRFDMQFTPQKKSKSKKFAAAPKNGYYLLLTGSAAISVQEGNDYV